MASLFEYTFVVIALGLTDRNTARNLAGVGVHYIELVVQQYLSLVSLELPGGTVVVNRLPAHRHDTPRCFVLLVYLITWYIGDVDKMQGYCQPSTNRNQCFDVRVMCTLISVPGITR
jgi:hypothetical protein